MTNAELESRIMNAEKPEDEQNKLIAKCEGGLCLRNTAEARLIIKELVDMVKNNQKQLEYEKRARQLNKQAEDNNKQRAIEVEKNLAISNELRLFYQHTLLKFCRDQQLYMWHCNYSKFLEINENVEDVEKQLDYKFILEKTMSIKEELVDFVNKNHGTRYHLRNIMEKMKTLGLLGDASGKE